MNGQLKALYQETSDFLTYVKLYAPDFPARDEMTCEKAVLRLFEYLGMIDELEHNPTAKQWLRVCREQLRTAEKLFEELQPSQGRRTLDSARDYLNNASQRKSMKPTFVVAEPGFAE